MTPHQAVPGTQGYAEEAEEIIPRYETIPFEAHHAPEMHLLPTQPGRVLDIGAGTGVDAAWFADRGHTVVAVEPTDAFRQAAQALHPSPSIEWLNDALPHLDQVIARQARFDLIMLSGVWMHLDKDERQEAMPRLTQLLTPNGILVLSLRHWPVPPGRRMFEVSGQETVALAQVHGLGPVLHVQTESIQAGNRASGVTWTRLAFRCSLQGACLSPDRQARQHHQ
ncbi:MAG: methyltransferase domain-containing protein [Pseudomonadota bacterium]